MLAVFGGNSMAVPAIRCLRELGHKVLVIDGNPIAAARDEADMFLHQDFTDVSSTLERLKGFELTGSMPLNDFSIAAAAQLARSRGLPGWSPQSEACFRSKVLMKKAWLSAGLPTAQAIFTSVRALFVERLPVWNLWPCVVKPSFSGGGSRGVFVARDWDEVRAGLSQLREKYLDGEVVIEEFIEGTEHTAEVVVYDGTPHLISISDKENYPGSLTVVQNLYFPGPIGTAHRNSIEPLLFAATRVLQARNGALHFEVLMRDSQPYLLEVGGRPGGGINFHPICELSTGYNYPDILGSILTGRRPEFSRSPATCLAWHYFPNGSGILHRVDGFDEVCRAEGVVDAMLYEQVGKRRFDLSDDLARPGYLLVRAPTIPEARKRASSLVEQVQFLVVKSEA